MKALTKVSGMMSSRKPVTLLLVRLADVSRRPPLVSSVAGSTLSPAPGPDEIGDDQADGERERRDGEEIGHRLGADPAERLQIRHAGDAGDDGEEDDRR